MDCLLHIRLFISLKNRFGYFTRCIETDIQNFDLRYLAVERRFIQSAKSYVFFVEPLKIMTYQRSLGSLLNFIQQLLNYLTMFIY